MDMHNLSYPDNSFDALYSSFVITYSDDIPKAVKETIRVCRSGALVAFGFQHMQEGGGNKFGLNRLAGGSKKSWPHCSPTPSRRSSGWRIMCCRRQFPLLDYIPAEKVNA